MSDAEGAARASGAMTQDSFDKIEELLRRETEGDYKIERLLGKGGMAVVYLAREVHLARNVAIKVLPPELTFGHGVERFKREAKTAAALDHPNIIPIYRVSAGGSLFWYAMKFLEGQSLEQLLKDRGTLPLPVTIKILRQVADALDYAHEHQVVHRDMKPANVMLDSRNRVIVTDFGIAKALTEGTLTASGSVIGTPYFMSPEQGMGKPVTGASDQYSVGVMAYRMLAGHVPFEGDSAIDVLHKHCMMQPPALETEAQGLPRHVYLAVHRALDKNPERRFPSVNAFIDAMGGEAAGAAALSMSGTGEGDATLVVGMKSVDELATTPMPSMARSMPGYGTGEATTGTPPPTPQTIPPRPIPRPAPKKKRSPVPLIAAAVIVIGGGAAGAYFATRPKAPTATPVQTAATPAQRMAQQPPVRDTTPPVATQPAPEQAPATQPAAQTPSRPAAPAVTTGTLLVIGLPSNGTIVVDNRRVIRNQSSVELSPGSHSITLAAQGFDSQDLNVTIRLGEVARVTFSARAVQATAPAAQPQRPAQPAPSPAQPTMSAEQGLLRIGVNVVADISIDREFRAKRNRYEEIVLAGDHLIDLRAAGFRDTSVAVRLNGRDTVTVRVNMERR